jgi:SAM-dependent methyltransferase
VAGTVAWLEDAPGAVRPGQPEGDEHPMRKVTKQVAFDGGWDEERRRKVAELFDSMASEWTASHDGAERRASISDALDRGAVRGGHVVELGSGSGMGTEQLAERFDGVVAVDLSLQMLLAAPPAAGARVQGDSSTLPLRSDSADTLMLVNMLLFPAEIDRVLSTDGQLVWVNTSAERTPIHLMPEEVVKALPGEWAATAGRAGTGLWCVASRVS